MKRVISFHASAILGGCLALLASGCVTPRLAPAEDVPWPHDIDLASKATRIEAGAWARVTDHGMLVYRWREPFDDLDNFRRSHALADAAAWQGYFIAALAFKGAALNLTTN